jgi:DNA-binding NarL/FixJ family response regulator
MTRSKTAGICMRIAVVEDGAAFRRQIVETLHSRSDWLVVKECANADDALRLLPPAQPDIVLLDIGLPRTSGLEIIRPLRQSLPRARIIMLTVVEDSREIARAIGLGAHGYLLKKDRPSLIEGVEDVLAERAPAISASVARRIWSLLEDLKIGVDSEFSPLTPRQGEVLRLASKGKQRKEIAETLQISPSTVKGHLAKIFEKLHVHSVPEALIKVRGGRDLLDWG